MGGAQVKGMQLLNAAAETEPARTQRYGHPILHFNKAMTSSMRNNRVTDGRDEFCIVFLVAIYCSSTVEAKQLASLVSKAVFDYKDRHADRLCYETHCKPVRDLWSTLGHVKCTVVPEQYRQFAPNAANHHVMDRPTFVATTLKGDIIISDSEKHCVMLCTRNNPTRLKIICGTVDQPGDPSDGVGTNTHMRFPSGLAVIRHAQVLYVHPRCLVPIDHLCTMQGVDVLVVYVCAAAGTAYT
eukprot:1190695-Prorocentrum_minimum.AAC.4